MEKEKEFLNFCEKLIKEADSRIRERGWDYYVRKKVRELVISEGPRGQLKVEAEVSGKKNYFVILRPDWQLYCSCPYARQGYLCKHMVATCYRAMDEIERRLKINGKSEVEFIKNELEPQEVKAKNGTFPAIFVEVRQIGDGEFDSELKIVGVKETKHGIEFASWNPADKTFEKVSPENRGLLLFIRDRRLGDPVGLALRELKDYPYKIFRFRSKGEIKDIDVLKKLDFEPEPFKVLAIKGPEGVTLLPYLPTIHVKPYFFHVYPDEGVFKLTNLSINHSDFYYRLSKGIKIEGSELDEVKKIFKRAGFELIEKEILQKIKPRLVITIFDDSIGLSRRYVGTVEFEYGKTTIRPEKKMKLLHLEEGIAQRDLKYEETLIKKLRKILGRHGISLNTMGIFSLSSRNDFIDFLKFILPEIAKLGAIVLYGREKRKIKTLSDYNFSVSIKSDIDWFEAKTTITADAPLEFDDQTAIRKMVAEGLEWINLTDGTIVVNDKQDEALSELLQTLGLVEKPSRKISKYEILGVPDTRYVSFDREAKKIIKSLKNLQKLKEVPLPDLRYPLRDYQKEGYYWLYSLLKNGFGGILADDMGLGKTAQVIALIAKDRADKPYLVIAPTTVIENWKLEIEKFAPEIRAHVIKAGSEIPEAFNSGEVYITSYNLAQKHSDKFTGKQFRFVILDEAQAIKNPRSKRARAVKKLEADFRLALTGTPIENSLVELWSIFDFIMPGLLGTYKSFREKYIRKAGRLDLLKKKISPFILRRTKEKVLKQLPPKIEQVVFLDMPREQRKIYESMLLTIREEMEKDKEELTQEKFKFKVLTYLLRLRQLCLHPRLVDERLPDKSVKLDALKDMISEIVESGHRVLIFSQFVKMLKMIENVVTDIDIPYLYLDGSTPDRQKLIDKFNTGKYPVFLLSLKAGGVGINLTQADYVVIFDPWWNPAVENQAMDRTHRIGQRKTVFVYKLISRDTVEEKILRLQEKKKKLVRDVIPDDRTVIQSLTPEEIEEIFSS